MVPKNAIFLMGLDLAKVLAVLYNAASPKGIWFSSYDPAPLTVKEAQEELDPIYVPRFETVRGRVLRIDLTLPYIDPTEYNKHNGLNCAEWVIDLFLDTNGDVNPPEVRRYHRDNVERHALSAKRVYIDSLPNKEALWNPDRKEERIKIAQDLARIQKGLKLVDKMRYGRNAA
jgi:hypothetical protein